MFVIDGFGLLRLLCNLDIGNFCIVLVVVMMVWGDGDLGVYMKFGFCGCIYKFFFLKGLLVFIFFVMEGRSVGMFLFDYFCLMESMDDCCYMFGFVVKELEKDFVELEEVLRENDWEVMWRIVYWMVLVWELLGVNDVLFGYWKFLYDKILSDEMVREYMMRIMK